MTVHRNQKSENKKLIRKVDQVLRASLEAEPQNILEQICAYWGWREGTNVLPGLSDQDLATYKKIIRCAQSGEEQNLEAYLHKEDNSELFSKSNQTALVCSNLHYKPSFESVELPSPFIRKSFKEFMQPFISQLREAFLPKENIQSLNQLFEIIPAYFREKKIGLELRIDSRKKADFILAFDPPGYLPMEHHLSSPLHGRLSEVAQKHAINDPSSLKVTFVELDQENFSNLNRNLNLFFSCPKEFFMSQLNAGIADYGIPPLHPENYALLEKCFANCPKGVFHCELGIMEARNALKWVAFGFTVGEVVPFLEGLNWQGDFGLLKKLLDVLKKKYSINHVALSLDLEKSAVSNVGVEIHDDNMEPPFLEPWFGKRNFSRLIDVLNDDMIKSTVLASKLRAIKKAPMITVYQPWCIGVTSIAHVKLIIDREIQSKLYFCQYLE